MDRRAFVAGAVGILATPLAGEAQQAGRMFRIGLLGVGSPGAMRQSLSEAGYVEGRNLAIEWRDAEGKAERFGDLAAELVRLKVDLIVASNPAATFAARKATASIPIVMVNTPDPVQLGLVVSLGRPGGNVTGTTTLSADLSIKQLELLKEAIPRAVRIAVLWVPSNPWHPLALKGRRGCRPIACGTTSKRGGAWSRGVGQCVRGNDQGNGRRPFWSWRIR